MGKKRLSAADSDTEAVFPSGDIPCEKCDLAYMNGKKSPKKGTCMAFPIKPPEIMFDGAKCPYYVEEE